MIRRPATPCAPSVGFSSNPCRPPRPQCGRLLCRQVRRPPDHIERMPFVCPSGVLTAHAATSTAVAHTLVANPSTSSVVELGPRHESHVLLRPSYPAVHPLTRSWAGELGSAKRGWGLSENNPRKRHGQAGSIIPQAHEPWGGRSLGLTSRLSAKQPAHNIDACRYYEEAACLGAPLGHHLQGSLALTPLFTRKSAKGSQRACLGIHQLSAHHLRPMRET